MFGRICTCDVLREELVKSESEVVGEDCWKQPLNLMTWEDEQFSTSINDLWVVFLLDELEFTTKENVKNKMKVIWYESKLENNCWMKK